MRAFLEARLGPNYRTTFWGVLTVLAGAIYTTPELVAFLPPMGQRYVVGIAGLITAVTGCKFAGAAADGRKS